MHFLVTFSEITLKSERVRTWMERELQNNINQRIGARKVENLGSIFHFEGVESEIELLKCIPGISTIFICDELTGNDLTGKLLDHVVELASSFSGTFAIRSRNLVGSSTELNGLLGAKAVEKYGLKVDLENPQNIVYVRLEKERAFIGSKIIAGLGGLPYGSQGKVLVLFSGGIDSPLASLMFLRKGCHPYFLFFDIAPFHGDGVVERAKNALGCLKEYAGKIELITIPFGDVLNRIVESQHRGLTCVMCKRSMYRAANIIAKKHGAIAIVTGDSLGEVASQTLQNLSVLDDASEMMVLRPLIGFTKQESVDMSKKYKLFGAYSKLVSCTAVPSHVDTAAILSKVKNEEERLCLDKLIEASVENAKFEKI